MITRFFVDVACDLPERRAGALFLEFANAAVSWVGQIIPGPAIMDGSRGPRRPTVRIRYRCRAQRRKQSRGEGTCRQFARILPSHEYTG